MKLPPGFVPGQAEVKASGYGGYGERLLRSMGWDKGQGLGRCGTGIREAIQVKKKEDNAGIGGNNCYRWDNKWWEFAFDSAIQTANNTLEDDSSDSDDDTDDEHITSTSNRDGTRSSASLEELKLLASLSNSKSSRIAAGRFSGRDAKLERIRAQEAALSAEAASKLGVALPSNQSSDKTPKVQKMVDKDEPQEKATKRQRIVIEPVIMSDNECVSAFVATPPEGWWGSLVFTSVGCLEGTLTSQRDHPKGGFDEDDQEKIFNAAHAGKTQGKVGLGQQTRTVKVGGGWQGHKITFDSKAVDKKRTQDNLKSIKWKRLIVRALKGSPSGTLRLKALKKTIAKDVNLGKKDAQRCILETIEGCRTLEMLHGGKTVQLRKKSPSV